MKNSKTISYCSIKEEKRSVASVAKDFGGNEQTIRNWLKANEDSQDPLKARIAELEAELKAKGKKIADQELTIDILKKAPTSSLKATGSNLSVD